jgi:hypothetical protein
VPATARVGVRLRDATAPAHVEAPEEVPGVRPVTGLPAPLELLRRHLPSPGRTGARRSRVVSTAVPAPRRGHARTADAPHLATVAQSPFPDASPPRDVRPLWPARERGPRTAVHPPEETAPTRPDVPVPAPLPTASERLGPAPVLTVSHPPLFEPDPVGAQTVPIAGATLRRGAVRDAAVPDFLDSVDLTNRIARVLRDEARRHGIEV